MVCVGLCWARVGTILGLSWAILTMLGHFGPCWHHIGLMLGHFGLFNRICGRCFGLGHFSVVDFSSMQGVCKKHSKY